MAFGIIEQNWLQEHIGKVIDLKTVPDLDAAEWELTYFILFAITNGCGTAAAKDPMRTTAVLKAFHRVVLQHIADQAGPRSRAHIKIIFQRATGYITTPSAGKTKTAHIGFSVRPQRFKY